MSKQAIDKRFNERTKHMLTEILQSVISKQINRNFADPKAANFFSQIRIMDSSEFKVSKNVKDTFPGYGGPGREAMVQIQFEYELLGGQVTRLSLGSALNADITAGMEGIDNVPARSLLLRDLGYFAPKTFAELSKRDISFISRGKTQWNYYIIESNKLKLLTTKDIIDKLKMQEEKYLDIEVLVGEQARTPVRLVANLLNDEQTKKRLKRKRSHLGKLGKDAKEGACLNLFLTNIEREKCNASEIYQLYCLRWQVELIFKTWKSILKIHKIHSMNSIRLECILLVKLLWIMLNWSILRLLQQVTCKELSLHKLSHTIMSRSKIINATILQDRNLLFEWILEMSVISMKHHIKEYKKGSLKQEEILACTFY